MDKSLNQNDNSSVLPAEIAPGIYLVGKNDKEAQLKCNPYLIVDNDEAVLIDPGSVLDFLEVFKNVSSIISPDKIRLIVAHHQDPDLCSSIPLFYRQGVKALVALHWRTSLIIRHYGIINPLYIVNENKWVWKFRSGRTLRFLPAPYCHFAGSIMTYDEKSHVVFSGDLFGSLVYSRQMYADETYREGMKAFHEHYMPSHEVLMPVMDLLLRLKIELIAPQHGCIIKDNIESFIMELRQLECGSLSGSIPLTTPGLPGSSVVYTAFLNEILDRLSALFSPEKVQEMFYNSQFELDKQSVHISGIQAGTDPKNTVDVFFQTLADRDGIRWITVIEPFVKVKLQQYRLPIPYFFLQNENDSGVIPDTQAASDVSDIILYDTLTGLYNKTVFARFIEELLKHRPLNQFGVIYFSVDVNSLPSDERTTEKNATVFKSFAYILRSAAAKFISLRVFKLDTDVFACIAEDSDEEKTRSVLTQIRQSARASGFFVKGINIPAAVLYSSRISEIPGIPDESSINHVLLRMLELAKQSGPYGISDSFQNIQVKNDKKQIALLEPDTTYINFLLPHFQQKGYELKVYRNGKELSSAVDNFIPDLFIAEAMTPQFSGFELREKLLKMPGGQSKPFILISHRKDETFIRRAADLGIVFFLKKPFLREELFGLVDNLLR
ncbi:MAG: response regulator [Treponema sp.]|nr:response regulator [Treponema sp.]